MSASARLFGILAAAAALACASDSAKPGEVARVSVEVLRGFSSEDVAPRESTAPVVVLLDATRSMLEPTRQGSNHWLAAQRAAARFANELPSQRGIWLYELGAADAPDCQALTASPQLSDRDCQMAVTVGTVFGPSISGSSSAPIASGRIVPIKGSFSPSQTACSR